MVSGGKNWRRCEGHGSFCEVPCTSGTSTRASQHNVPSPGICAFCLSNTVFLTPANHLLLVLSVYEEIGASVASSRIWSATSGGVRSSCKKNAPSGTVADPCFSSCPLSRCCCFSWFPWPVFPSWLPVFFFFRVVLLRIRGFCDLI